MLDAPELADAALDVVVFVLDDPVLEDPVPEFPEVLDDIAAADWWVVRRLIQVESLWIYIDAWALDDDDKDEEKLK